MPEVTGPGQSASGMRPMSTATGIVLMTIGAILPFAPTAGSPQWLNLHMAGAIFMPIGIVGLARPRRARSRNGFRRWVAPMLTQGLDEPDLTGTTGPNPRNPTLADDIPGTERDPPAYDLIRDR